MKSSSLFVYLYFEHCQLTYLVKYVVEKLNYQNLLMNEWLNLDDSNDVYFLIFVYMYSSSVEGVGKLRMA